MCVDELQATLLVDLLATLQSGGAGVAHPYRQIEVGVDHSLLSTAIGDHTLHITDEGHIPLIIGGADHTLLMKVDADPTLGRGPLTRDHHCTIVAGTTLLITPGTTHQMIGIMEEDIAPGTIPQMTPAM